MARPTTLLGYPVAGLLALLVTWVVWGSTYLGIRLAVREGAGWGPFWLGAARVFVAAAVLLVVCRLRRVRVRPSGRELAVIAGSGVLMWVCGNGAVNWAEQRIESGLAALVVGAMPMWVVVMESLLDRRRPGLRLVAAVAVGFAGLAVLTLPLWRHGLSGDLAGVGAVVCGAIAWGAGSVWMSRRPTGVDSFAVAGLQQLAGGVGFLVAAAATAEPLPHPTPEAWAAFAYLTVFGSVVAYTCFVYALKALPTTLVMTYTYVNPVIAVILGWLLIDEPITGYTVAGTALIVAGVCGVFSEKRRAFVRRTAPPPPPAVTRR
ncbi:MAG: EamA family transporter [Thermoanaerobaculales bacterium]|nr:EamA family transporter [Thermoanaerobaculales bacterium]